MLGLFAAHNRSWVHVVCFATGPDDHSVERQTVQRTCDAFVDVSVAGPAATADAVVSHAVDVLIDYDGLHGFNNVVTAMLRPAATILAFLGFAGPMGSLAPHDFSVVDTHVAPVEHAATMFGATERLLYLPTCTYQPQNPAEPFDALPGVVAAVHSGQTRQVSLHAWRQAVQALREANGLPADAVVLACFNRHSKIEPPVFAAWMNVMRAVPDAVLWLYANTADAQPFVRSAAAAAGVHPSRVVFMSRVPKPAHLARHYAADLFLSTMTYGAHTTAADALSTGLPVLTPRALQAEFSSRVAAGLLACLDDAAHAVLTAATLTEYETTAVRLAMQPGVLLRLRLRLLRVAFPDGRASGGGGADSRTPKLFSPTAFASGLEAAVTAAHTVQAVAMGSRLRWHVVVSSENHASNE